MKKLFAIAFVIMAIKCQAQKTPAAVKNSFAKNFPGIAPKNWDEEKGKYEANFTKGTQKMSATFSADGTLEETETDIAITKLPSSVINYIKSNYKHAVVKEAALINRGSDNMYEAEVKGKDLLFDRQGKFLQEEAD